MTRISAATIACAALLVGACGGDGSGDACSNAYDPEVDDYNVSSSADLAGLEGVEVICGNLRISGLGDVTVSLPDLEDVRRGLAIVSNAGLRTAPEFPALRSIGSQLDIRDNYSLTSFDAFPALERMGDGLWIVENENLESVSGFEKLAEIGGDVAIEQNPALSEIRGFDSLSAIRRSVRLRVLPSLQSITGFESFTTIEGRLAIQVDTPPEAISWLDTLEYVGAELALNWDTPWVMPNLREVGEFGDGYGLLAAGALPSLEVVGYLDLGGDEITALELPDTLRFVGRLKARTTALTSLSGLSRVEELGGLVLEENPSLTTLDGLGDRIELTSLHLDGNAALRSVEALSGVERIENEMSITDAPLLEQGSLSSLVSIGGSLEIAGDEGLANAALLPALGAIGESLTIENNVNLQVLPGLSLLHALGGNLRVVGNPKLPTCAVEALLLQLDGFSGQIQIEGNDDQASCGP